MTRHVLVIGAQRCGTTYLAALLDSHPDITMARPAIPEPKVFLSDELARRGRDWYLATYFAHATAEHLLGEKSTSYLEDPLAARRAAETLGHVQVVAQLRDPVDRAVSNWQFSTRHGLEKRPLEQALRENLDGPRRWDRSVTSVSPYAYLERGRYVDYLEPWLQAFPDSVHISFLDDVATEAGALGRLYETLRVDPRHRPTSFGEPVNRSDAGPPALPSALYEQLQAYFRDSDVRLQQRIGLALPWLAGLVEH